jgi:hypothetical protein
MRTRELVSRVAIERQRRPHPAASRRVGNHAPTVLGAEPMCRPITHPFRKELSLSVFIRESSVLSVAKKDSRHFYTDARR